MEVKAKTMQGEIPGRNCREVSDELALTTTRASVQYHGTTPDRLPQARDIGKAKRTKNLLSLPQHNYFTATRGITNAQMV